MLNKIRMVTAADQTFHNRYIRDEVFSHAIRGIRYSDQENGNYLAAKGFLKLIQLKAKHENNLDFTICTLSGAAMDRAAGGGHLETVKWLHENRSEGCTIFAIGWAACDGHLETIKWLHENRTENNNENRTENNSMHAISSAVKWGQLQVVQWFCENYTEICTKNALYWSVLNRRVQVTNWLLDNQKNCIVEHKYKKDLHRCSLSVAELLLQADEDLLEDKRLAEFEF